MYKIAYVLSILTLMRIYQFISRNSIYERHNGLEFVVLAYIVIWTQEIFVAIKKYRFNVGGEGIRK